MIRAAGRQRAEAQARQELARLDVRPVADPVRELRRVGGQIVAWKDVCAAMVNRLDPEGLRYEGKLHGEQLRAEVQMWTDALKMSVQVLTALGKLDLDNWQTAIDQQRAEMMAAAFESAHARAGLPADRAAIARAAFTSRLRVLAEEEDDGVITGVVIPSRTRPLT